MTVDELRERLSGLKGHWQITFGELEFGRIKQRGPELVDIPGDEPPPDRDQ